MNTYEKQGAVLWLTRNRGGWISILPSLLHTPFSHRKQHRLGGRSIGNGLEFRVLPPERFRNLYFRSFQDADELQGIDDGLALKVIVGDHERSLSGQVRRQCPATH